MILITGASGFVGSRLMADCPQAVACPSLRNADTDAVRRAVEESGADVIVHTAAISDIGACDADPDAAYAANVLLPVHLARAAAGRKLICFSSDQVYGGCAEEGPYSEEKAAPANLYAAQKLEMEQRVLDICPDAVLLRAEWMYDYGATRPNYLMQVLHSPGPLAFSSRQFRGLTYLKEVAENLPAVVRLPGGVYNFGSETTQSMYQITADFLRLLGRDTPLADAPAHHNLWMDCGKARRYGVDFSPVSAALARCARDYRLIPE